MHQGGLEELRAARYASFDQGEGKRFEEGKLNLEALTKIALQGSRPKQISGKQERYENILNQFI